jgi:hypothetical protein
LKGDYKKGLWNIRDGENNLKTNTEDIIKVWKEYCENTFQENDREGISNGCIPRQV